MAHLIKLAVGSRTVEDIDAWQRARARGRPTHVVPTRQFPKRAPEILAAGGSLYWVVAGLVAARQEIADIHEVTREDGTRGTAIVVRCGLVPVTLRPMRAFQGWRYLEPDAAPPDLAAERADSGDTLPPALVRELAALCLL